MLLFHIIVMMLLSLIPLLLRIYSLELVIQIIKLCSHPFHFFVDNLKSFEDYEKFVFPE